MPRTKDDDVFFWKIKGENDWGSQWYPSPFTATITFPPSATQGQAEDVKVTVTFPTAEHWMMMQKALLFGDTEVAREILGIKGSENKDCKRVKALGRNVGGFNEEVWTKNRERIVHEGSLLKFRQNPEIREKLEQTGDRMIVEASPKDNIWGIGLDIEHALDMGEELWGLNLLGQALMGVRDVLRKEAKAKKSPTL